MMEEELSIPTPHLFSTDITIALSTHYFVQIDPLITNTAILSPYLAPIPLTPSRFCHTFSAVLSEECMPGP